MPVPAAQPAPSPPTDDALRERLLEAERRREQAESELHRELEKKQEIRKAVAEELGRMESQLTETTLRVRRKDEEHASALEALAQLKEARDRDKAADLAAAQGLLEKKAQSFRDLETQLKERHKTVFDLQDVLDAVRIEANTLRSELGTLKTSSDAELAGLRKKLAAADARLAALKSSETQLSELRKEASALRSKSEELQSELGKRDQRIKELQLLIKTLGERLNDLTSRRF